MAKTSNSYGHPHQVTIDALNQVGAVIYGTDMLGTIVITTNGQSVSPVTWFRLE
jgi:competence protein ComEC